MKKLMERLKKDLWVVLLDIIAVNASYYLALLIRFYVNFTLRPVAVNEYLPAWISFAPWYTVLSLIIFACWRLYGGMWRYAGINDMNRIILANLCTTTVHVLGTALFVCRMPITYYVIGAGLQFLLIVIIRFSYRVLLVEKKRLSRGERIPALVVGSGELGRKVIKHLEDGRAYKPVAVVGKESGRTLDGVPVISLSSLKEQIDKIQAIFIADPLISAEMRAEIKEIAGDLELVDYTGYQANMSGRIPLTALLSVATGPVTVMMDEELTGEEKKEYDSPEATMKAITEKMDVVEVMDVKVRLKKSKDSGWNVWAENYSATTGQDVSVL